MITVRALAGRHNLQQAGRMLARRHLVPDPVHGIVAAGREISSGLHAVQPAAIDEQLVAFRKEPMRRAPAH